MCAAGVASTASAAVCAEEQRSQPAMQRGSELSRKWDDWDDNIDDGWDEDDDWGNDDWDDEGIPGEVVNPPGLSNNDPPRMIPHADDVVRVSTYALGVAQGDRSRCLRPRCVFCSKI